MVIDLNPFAVVIGAFLLVVLVALLLARRQAQRNPVASRPPLPAYVLSFLSNFDNVEERKPELTDVYVKLEDVRRKAEQGVDWEDVTVCRVRHSGDRDLCPWFLAANLGPATVDLMLFRSCSSCFLVYSYKVCHDKGCRYRRSC